MPRSFQRREAAKDSFTTWLNQQPGIIRYPAPVVDGATNRIAHNLRVTGVEDSRFFPKADVVVNGTFAADTDWNKGDAAITIAGGKATWSGAQAGDADLTATVAPLANGVRYVPYIVLSGVAAGTLTVLHGTQAGAAMSANGVYKVDEQIANGTALVLRGDSSFIGSCELIRMSPSNPLNASITSATVAQPFGRGGLRYANLYDGNNDFDQLPAATLDLTSNWSEGTLMVFCQITDPNVWIDGLLRRIVFIRIDADNQISLHKSVVNNLQTLYEADNVALTRNITTSTLDRFMLALTWSKSTGATGEVRTFFNGVQNGPTLTNLGVWSDGALNQINTLIGAGANTPALLWSGLISDVIINPTRAMSPREIAEYFRRWGG